MCVGTRVYVLEGIVQGYIVDAFSEIRGAEAERESDSTTNCLVCSCSKFELQRVGVDFEEHVEEAHNRWSYLYLANAVRSEAAKGWLGTTAAIVKSALDQNSVDFMPLETTYEMNTDHGEEDKVELLSHHVIKLEQSMHAQMQEVHAQLQEVSNHVVNMQ